MLQIDEIQEIQRGFKEKKLDFKVELKRDFVFSLWYR